MQSFSQYLQDCWQISYICIQTLQSDFSVKNTLNMFLPLVNSSGFSTQRQVRPS